MNNFLYSEGSMKTTVNNQVIDDKSYKFEYDGDIGKGVVQNNKDSYYVELDDGDFEKIFKKNHDGNTQNIERKLKDLLNDNKSAKSTTAKSTTAKSTTAKSTTAKSTTAKSTTAKSTTAKRKTRKKSMKPSIKSKSFQERNDSPITKSPKKSIRKSTQKNRKSKRKSKRTSNRKSNIKSKRSIKKTNKMPLETNFLQTLI